MATSDEKLLQIAAIVSAPTDIPVTALAAYDRPPIAADDASLIKDSHTYNRDGSVWTLSPPFGGGTPIPVCTAFGYISPVKTPEVWAWAQQNMTAAGFAEFDSRWKSNPYGLYRADPRDLIERGVVNLVSFSYTIQPFVTYQQ